MNLTSHSEYVLLVVSGRIVSDEQLNETLEAVEKALDHQKKMVVCDLSSLEYCNSTGLNFFIRMLTRARKVGGDCVLTNLQPSVKKLFEISKLDEIFNCQPTVEEALAHLTK